MSKRSLLDSVSPEYVQSLLDTSDNYVEVLKTIGYSSTSGNARKYLFKYIKENGLKTDKLEENLKKWRSKLIQSMHEMRVIPLEDIFSGKKPYKNSYRLARRLVEEGYKMWKCECCGLTEWDGDPIPLQLHHDNGDKEDNSLINLKLLCPNCHALTDNYCGRNT
jgi:hypothetical protein